MHPRDASVAVSGAGDFGRPTFLVGDEMYFGKDRRRAVEDGLVRLRSS